MSWRERSAWICLVSTCLIFGVYFRFVVQTFETSDAVARPVLVAFLLACVALAVVTGVVHIVSALVFGVDKADERDAKIEATAVRVAYFFLIGCVFTAIACMAVLGAAQTPSSQGRIWVPGFSLASQAVLFVFVVAEVLRYLVQVIFYRMDAR
jgi:hypothetical protein